MNDETTITTAGGSPLDGGVRRLVPERDDFLHGVCVALQVVTAMDCGVTWCEIVQAVGEDDILRYAAHVEPDEWELAGFAKYARRELRRNKPRVKRALPPLPQGPGYPPLARSKTPNVALSGLPHRSNDD